MDVINRNKTAQRTSFTKSYKKLETMLAEKSDDIDEIEMCLELFKQRTDALEATHISYLDNLLDEKEFETQFDLVEEYREKSLRIQMRTQRFLENFKKKSNEIEDSNSASCCHVSVDENRINLQQRLPKIELYKFGGELKDWLTFWNQFKNIHENKDLTNADKFHYLIQSTKIKSEAREIVESFPVTDENYSLAVETLTERYGRKELLIDFYIRELLKLVLNNATNKKHDSLSGLYNKLSTQLRALSSLGVTTDQCGIILYPLVESSLPVHILRSFERRRKIMEMEHRVSSLETIVLFLKEEVQAEEKIKLSRSDIYSTSPHGKRSANFQNSKDLMPSESNLISHQFNDASKLCAFCSKDHESRNCKKAFFIPLEEKHSVIKRKGLCRVCMISGHISNNCRANIKCPICSKRHLKFMCPNLEGTKANITNEVPKQNDDSIDKVVDSMHSRVANGVILQTLLARVSGKTKRMVRIILDMGSQRSYILNSTAKEMEFECVGEEEFSHALFGGTTTKMQKHKCYKIYLSNIADSYTCKLDALDQDVICKDISSIPYGSWITELKKKGVHLSDTQEDSGCIDILLGADVVGKLLTGRRIQLESGLVALETKLGWTILGKIPKLEQDPKHVNMNVVSMLSNDMPVSSLWDLELLGIRDPVEQSNREESKQAIMFHFQETVRQKEDGRYEVHMPWKRDHAHLPDNYDLSLKRLECTTKRLEKTGYRAKYHEVFAEWLQEEVIEEVPEEELFSPVVHYLPHRPVIKETLALSSMKIRPVFDASAKLHGHPSLNDCLETGINLIETIPSILTRFRLNEIGVISDIRRAFLQISLHEKDRDFLRFLWYDEENSLKIFRHTRVVFGITCSPFLLMAVINHHLSKAALSQQYSEELLKKLQDSFYVDNCVTSVGNVRELNSFVKVATEILERGKFDLRGWESNDRTIGPTTKPDSPVLGLIWNRSSDTFKIDSESLKFDEAEEITKRKILSLVSRVFDPIGFISPALIQPKVLLQTAWKTGKTWDAEVEADTKKEFLKWFQELQHLKDLQIPRWLGSTPMSRLSLHTFVDASKLAYAACVFLKSESPDGIVNVQLIQAKSRITPLKKITIPRLELMAAAIGARLFESVKLAMQISVSETYFWTDSSTVLTWIKRQELWSVFVNNRVTEIRKLTKSENWFHIPGDQNPADLLSRGCGPRQLLKSMWWQGPNWLKNSSEQWPKSKVNANENEIDTEKRRSVVSASNVEFESITLRLTERISTFSKIVRVLAWVLRFQLKSKDLRRKTNLTEDELANAQKVLFRSVQAECFSGEEKRKSLMNLQVYEDNENMLRLKSRLTNDDESQDFIAPLILPAKHPMVERLIEQEHLVHKHAGVLTLLVILRENFWILKGRRTIRGVIRKCLTCKRQRIKNLEVPFPPLPLDRTRISAAFKVTGIDLAGPLLTKSKEKVWIVVFSCAVFRAVHLELVPALSTSALIQAIRRFIARRGRISVMYSDNGTNFTGLNSALKQLDWTKIQREFELNAIHWNFNPPSAPWWGGFWERLIGILKDLLRKNLGRSSLTNEELQTLVCECESVMNSRPLTYVPEESGLRTLTPSMFLQDLPTNEVADLDQIEKTHLVKRWRYVQRVRDALKQRFRKEYLGFLRSSNSKRQDKISIGDIVLVGSDDRKRLHWPLAKVIGLIPGRDGIVRLVKLNTAKGTLMRPIQRLYPLEITDEPKQCVLNPEVPCDSVSAVTNDDSNETVHVPTKLNNDSSKNIPVCTRSGRVVRQPERLNLQIS